MRTIIRGTFSSTGIFFETKKVSNLNLEQKVKELAKTVSITDFGENDLKKFKKQKCLHAELHFIDGSAEAIEARSEVIGAKIYNEFGLPEAFDLAEQVIASKKIPKGHHVTLYLDDEVLVNGVPGSAFRIEHFPNDSYAICIHGIGQNTQGFQNKDGILGLPLKNV